MPGPQAPGRPQGLRPRPEQQAPGHEPARHDPRHLTPEQTRGPDQQRGRRDGLPPVAMVEQDASQYNVPRVVTREVGDAWRRGEHTLFRGDTRSPDEIRRDGGFLPPYMARAGWEGDPDGARPDIAQHVGGQTNAFVSTSTDRTTGEHFAGEKFVYEINAPGGIHTDPTLHPVTGRETHGESEVLFPGGINWGYVRGWYQMHWDPGNGYFAGEFVANPDYVGDRASPPTTTEAATSPGADQAPPDKDPYGPSTEEAVRPQHLDPEPRHQLAQGAAGSLGDRMGPLGDPRLDALRPHLRSTAGGMSAFAPADPTDRRQRWDHQNEQFTANQVPRIPGRFVVDTHGSADSVRVGDTPLSPGDLAETIRANPDYDGGPVSLLGCGTGSTPDGFAARLARELGVPVTAPGGDAWVDHSGNVFASSQATDTDFGKPARPTWPPDGEWRTFAPDGGQTVHNGPFPPGHTPTWAGDLPARAAPAARRGDDTAAGPDAARERLDRVRRDWPEVDRVLTDSPVTRDSLLAHPDSVRMLDAALDDVRGRLDDAGITDAVRRGDLTPEARAELDSIVDDLRAEHPNQVLDRSEQLAISREIAAGTTRDGYRQSGFDPSRREDPVYQRECVDRLRAEAPRVQERLNRVVSEIAADNGGEASWRERVKDEDRCHKKVREYVEQFPDGDASMLVDVAGAKVRFQSVDELYRALGRLRDDPRVDIVRIKDRVAEATRSGNRSILMNVRVDGHVAELKFGLKSFEAPAAAEHPLYEVRRDVDSAALAAHRAPTPVESLVKAATEAHARREYGAAWNREMAASRLHEVLTDHADVASITQRLVTDSVAHPTNVARSLADPATRDATIATIGDLADGRALGGRTLDEYRAANPGRGPLFEPVDPSVNTGADGRDRKAALVEEAKRADPARDVGNAPSPAESARLRDYARRLREDVHPAVEAEVRAFVEQVAPGSSVSVRTKDAEGILDKVKRMTTGSGSRPGRPDYRSGDVIDAVGARITTSDMRDLARTLDAAKSHFGVGDGGRILEIENMYASPKSKNPAYRVIPLVVRVDVGGRPYTFELQLTTQRASIAADLEHNTLFKPYVEMSRTEKETVRRMLAEAAALDQEETRWNH